MKLERFFFLRNDWNIEFTYLVAVLAVCLLLWPQSMGGQQAPVPKMTLSQVEELVTAKVPDATLQVQIQKRGLTPAPTQAFIDSLRAKGAGPLTLAAVKAALHSSSQTVPSSKPPTRAQSIPAPAGTKPHSPVSVMIDSKVAEGLLLQKTDPDPRYLKIAKATHSFGTVELKVSVSEAGRVETAEAISGPPFLRVAAVETVKNWLYRPFMLNRAPVKFETNVSVPFTPDDSNSMQPPATQPASRPDQVSNSETWVDPFTNLMWATKDNGIDITQNGADNYCTNLRLGGQHGWRMPTIEELKGIYDASANTHIKGNISLTSSIGNAWSSTRGTRTLTWVFFSFLEGYQGNPATFAAHDLRALCVRGNSAPSSERATIMTNETQSAINHPHNSSNDVRANSETWIDPTTNLMWEKKDNGSDVNWQQATDYCQALHLANYSDWRMPTIEELKSIYDPSINVNDHHVKRNLQLSVFWIWSSSPGNNSGEARLFNFLYGDWASIRLGDHILKRALCVRRSGE